MDTIHTINDAKTLLTGVENWEWGSALHTDYDIITCILPYYLYNNADQFDTVDDVIKQFVVDELNQNPNDFF